MNRVYDRAAPVVLGVIVYTTVLYYTYKYLVAPTYAYSGLAYREPDTFGYAIALILVVGLTLILPRRLTVASDFILWLLFIMVVAPSILICTYNPLISPEQATELGVVIAASFLLVRVFAKVRLGSLMPSLKLDSGFLWILLAGYTTLVYVLLALFVGVRFQALSVTDVYGVRADYSQSVSTIPILGYLLPIQYSVINPLFMARGLYSRRWTLLAIGIGGQLAIYTSIGVKSVLFSVIVILGLAVAYRGARVVTAFRIVVSVVAGMVVCWAIDSLTGSLTLNGLLVRRFLVAPGFLTEAYVKVFAGQPKTHFSEFLPFASNSYSVSSARLVGAQVANDPGTSANVNWLGHGYSSLGYAGIFVESLVIILLLWLANEATRGLSPPVASMLFLMPAISLGSSSAFTSILTGGYLAAVIAAMILPRSGWEPRVRGRLNASRALGPD